MARRPDTRALRQARAAAQERARDGAKLKVVPVPEKTDDVAGTDQPVRTFTDAAEVQAAYIASGGAVPRRQVLMKPVARIHPNPRQPRRLFDPEALNALARSIAVDGLLHPIQVRPHDDPVLAEDDHWIIVCGERRWRAVKDILGATDIRVTLFEGENEARASLVENTVRSDLTAMEQALALAELGQLPDGSVLSNRELAKHIPLGHARIGHLRQIAALPDRIKASLLKGERRATSKALLRVAQEPDPKRQWQLFLEVSETDADDVEETPIVKPVPALRSEHVARDQADLATRIEQRARRGAVIARQLDTRLGELMQTRLWYQRDTDQEEIEAYRRLRARLDAVLERFQPDGHNEVEPGGG